VASVPYPTPSPGAPPPAPDFTAIGQIYPAVLHTLERAWPSIFPWLTLFFAFHVVSWFVSWRAERKQPKQLRLF
jgi:hypothetical protein